MTERDWRRELAEYGARLPLAAPADPGMLDAAERALALALPSDLRALFAECNGVTDHLGFRVVWPVTELAPRNEEFRTTREFRRLYMPFDALLFFGEVGNGDQFFYRILDGEVRESDVYLWDHETDSRGWRAPRLETLVADVRGAARES